MRMTHVDAGLRTLMPAETEPQDRVWMSFPVPGHDEFDGTPDERDGARRAWAAVANAAVEFEPVTVVVDPSEVANARALLAAEVELVVAPLDDAWLRDNGPTFVHVDDGSVAAVTWVFNGWGQQQPADRDARIGALVAQVAGVPVVPSPMVNEGGGILTDGRGTVVVTETVQLDPLRNPGLTRSDVERELARTTGATNVVWLARGLTRDSERFGTRGHADLLVAFPSPGVALVHTQEDPSHPDHEVSREVMAAMRASTTADGSPWSIVELCAPATLRDDTGWVDWSYVNHTPVNGGVVACAFDDAHDARAADVLASVYPGRRIVPVDARRIFARGGGIHCITQQQPSARA
jgi:agmatine deiminase